MFSRKTPRSRPTSLVWVAAQKERGEGRLETTRPEISSAVAPTTTTIWASGRQSVSDWKIGEDKPALRELAARGCRCFEMRAAHVCPTTRRCSFHLKSGRQYLAGGMSPQILNLYQTKRKRLSSFSKFVGIWRSLGDSNPCFRRESPGAPVVCDRGG